MLTQTWGKRGALSVCEERFKSHSRTESVDPHQPHRKNSIYNQKVQNSNIRNHRSWPRYRTGTHSTDTHTHTQRKFLQGINNHLQPLTQGRQHPTLNNSTACGKASIPAWRGPKHHQGLGLDLPRCSQVKPWFQTHALGSWS